MEQVNGEEPIQEIRRKMAQAKQAGNDKEFDELTYQYDETFEAKQQGVETSGGAEEIGIRPRDTPTPFPLHIYPDTFQRYIELVAASTETPVDAVAFAVLGILSAAYGTHIRVCRFEGYTTWCNLYCTMVGDSAFGKTPIFKHVQAPLEAIEDRLREIADEGVRDARVRATRLDIEREALIRAAKNENVSNFDEDLRELDDELQRLSGIKAPRIIVSDVTSESLVAIQSENKGAASMVSGEIPLWGILSGRWSKTPALEPFLCSFDGEGYRVDRITRGQNHVDEARLAILGGTQNAVMQDVHKRLELIDRGFVARHLFCKVESTYVEGPPTPVPSQVRAEYEKDVVNLGLRFRQELREPFEMSAAATECYDSWREPFKRRHKLPNGDLRDVAPFARKLEMMVLRIAGCLHVSWNPNPGTLEPQDIERALSIVEFAIDNFRAVDALIQEGPVAALVNSLKGWLRDKRGQTITLRDVRRHIAEYRRASSDTAQAALDELEADGIVKRENLNPGGKPSPAILVL